MADHEREDLDAGEQSLGAVWRGWGWGKRIAVIRLIVAAGVVAFDKRPGLLVKVSGWASSDVKSLFEGGVAADQAAQIAKQHVRSPASFKHVGGEVLWEGQTKDGLPAYVTSVSHDAANGFGAVLRGCMIIAYNRTADGQLTWNPMWGVKDYTDELPQLCTVEAPMKVKAEFARGIAEINSAPERAGVGGAEGVLSDQADRHGRNVGRLH